MRIIWHFMKSTKKETPENVFFLGRLGDYKYYDMDKAVERAIDLFEEINK